MTDGKSMLGKIVKVTVDRPMGSFHPKHQNLYYPVNYGYIEGIPAPDGEEQDVYILGVDRPVKEFTGRIIAVVRRSDDVEEKWVAAPEDMSFTREQIQEQIFFQEQYFQSEIILLYRKLRFWSSQKKERMFIEHTLDKHAFGYDNKTLAGSEDIETFFAKTIVKWIIFI